MKKILYIAAAVAATVACSKNIETTTQEIDNPNAFVKGQKVTLTVGTGIQTKVSSELVTTGEDKDNVSFKWATGDKILVKVGEATAEFTLKSGAGEAKATFEGTMPADGTTFDVQYPLTDPDLSTQTYSSSEAIPHDKMKFTASDCTVGTAFTLTAAYAALRLNLYGIDRKVSQIVITNTSSEADPKPTYALTSETPVKVSNSKDAPTPFFIVVPAGTSAWKFQAALKLSEVSPSVDGALLRNYESEAIGKGIAISCSTLVATELQTFTAGSVLNMPAQSVTIIWAPVNCGYDATDYPYGLLYQWGRKYGQGYYKAGSGSTPTYQDADYPGKVGGSQTLEKLENTSDRLTTHPDGDTYNGEFYCNQTNWYQGDTGAPAVDELWGTSKTAYDPCPEGWRVPTMSELDKLMGGDGTGTSSLGNAGWDGTNKGYWFNGTSSPVKGVGLFLPAAGCRTYGSGSADVRGYYGYCWSSSVNDDDAWFLYFGSGYAGVSDSYRAIGHSVRCVQE